jgi:hypothetical protein
MRQTDRQTGRQTGLCCTEQVDHLTNTTSQPSPPTSSLRRRTSGSDTQTSSSQQIFHGLMYDIVHGDVGGGGGDGVVDLMMYNINLSVSLSVCLSHFPLAHFHIARARIQNSRIPRELANMAGVSKMVLSVFIVCYATQTSVIARSFAISTSYRAVITLKILALLSPPIITIATTTPRDPQVQLAPCSVRSQPRHDRSSPAPEQRHVPARTL